MTRLMALATEESVLLSVKLMWSSVSSVTSTTGSRGAAIGSRRDAALSAPTPRVRCTTPFGSGSNRGR